MTEDEEAYYDEWKRKCEATRIRKKREIVEAAAKAEARALVDALDASPGYRRIKSGPNKGTVIWKGSHQQRLDEIVIAKENRRRAETERRARRLAEREASEAVLRSIKEKEATREKELVSTEIIWAYIFVFSVSIISFLIAKMFASFGIMGLAIFIDFICYMLLAKRYRHSRYLPFLWWILSKRK